MITVIPPYKPVGITIKSKSVTVIARDITGVMITRFYREALMNKSKIIINR